MVTLHQEEVLCRLLLVKLDSALFLAKIIQPGILPVPETERRSEHDRMTQLGEEPNQTGRDIRPIDVGLNWTYPRLWLPPV